MVDERTGGELHAVFAPGPRGTALASLRSRMPLRGVRAFPLPTGEAALQILHVGPGVMGGDRYRLDVAAHPGARALVIAQAATKLHAMPGVGADQSVRVRVDDGASLEMHPGLTIPYQGSAFTQRVRFDVATTGRLAYVERVAVGRVAHGERHRYRHLSLRTHLHVAGRTTYADALEWTPDDAAGVGIVEDFDVLASGIFVGGAPPPLAPRPGVRHTAYLVAEGVWVYRALAHDGASLRAATAAVTAAWRGHDGVDLDRFGS